MRRKFTGLLIAGGAIAAAALGGGIPAEAAPLYQPKTIALSVEAGAPNIVLELIASPFLNARGVVRYGYPDQLSLTANQPLNPTSIYDVFRDEGHHRVLLGSVGYTIYWDRANGVKGELTALDPNGHEISPGVFPALAGLRVDPTDPNLALAYLTVGNPR
jgi:hypothetical protein